MCGIGGIIGSDGAPDRAALQRMAVALGHRGPDDHGIEVLGNVGLVHTRLSIVDPSPAGHQPMTDRSRAWWISYNGEIYNHSRFRAETLSGVSFRGGSDTETLVELLACRGLADMAQLRGIFAFAALDEPRRTLHLCRDAFGVKPLYFARTPNGFYFASEIGALIAAGVRPEPRLDAIRHALSDRWVNGLGTTFEGINRIEPGSTMSIDLTTLSSRTTRWYDPADAVDPEAASRLGALTREETTRLVEEELRATVKRQLMSDVPLGTMCSGGIDSSLLTAFARDELPGLHAFNVSIGDQPDRDESPWAEAVAAKLDVQLHTIRLDRESWLAGLVPAVRHFEYPLSYEASVGQAAMSERARQVGVKVLLSGEGADELLGGYPWLHREDSADFFARNSVLRRGKRAAKRLRRAAQLRSKPIDLSWRCAESDEYDEAVLARCQAAYSHHRGARQRLEGDILSDFRVSMSQILCRSDKNTMQESIETRVPFLDQDLVALCVNLPLEHRIEPYRKNPLVTLAQRYLPVGLATRDKAAFNFDVTEYIESSTRPGFLADGMLRELLQVSDSEWRSSMLVAHDRSTMLWWTAEIWARLFLDGQSAEAVERELFTGTDAAIAG